MNFKYVIPCYMRMMPVILDFPNLKDGRLAAIFRIIEMLNNLLNICELDVWFVLTSNRKSWSWSRNPLVLLDLTSDLLVKVICDFQGQPYTKSAISALLK